jgi:hypothetical protein
MQSEDADGSGGRTRARACVGFSPPPPPTHTHARSTHRARRSGETVWERPTGGAAVPATPAAPAPASAAPASATKAALPPGWEEKFSNSKQKTYYFNKSTGATVWEVPKA